MASPVGAGAGAVAISMLRARGYAPSPATIEAILAESAHKVSELQTRVKEGRVLNLKALAEFIETYYPSRVGLGAFDPGLPDASGQIQPCSF
jgi:hypothetical protein